jgi:hypothetical protein
MTLPALWGAGRSWVALGLPVATHMLHACLAAERLGPCQAPANHGAVITPLPPTACCRGVSWHKREKRWRATLKVNGKQVSPGKAHLGLRDCSRLTARAAGQQTSCCNWPAGWRARAPAHPHPRLPAQPPLSIAHPASCLQVLDRTYNDKQEAGRAYDHASIQHRGEAEGGSICGGAWVGVRVGPGACRLGSVLHLDLGWRAGAGCERGWRKEWRVLRDRPDKCAPHIRGPTMHNAHRLNSTPPPGGAPVGVPRPQLSGVASTSQQALTASPTTSSHR